MQNVWECYWQEAPPGGWEEAHYNVWYVCPRIRHIRLLHLADVSTPKQVESYNPSTRLFTYTDAPEQC
jgi:hypothetical protein